MKKFELITTNWGQYCRMFVLLGILTAFACKQKAETREWINQPENGYVQEIKEEAYTLTVQYQPPSYRAEQEIILNHSSASRKELISGYDNLQQFHVKVGLSNSSGWEDAMLMTDQFVLVTKDTIPCVDVLKVPASPGTPFVEFMLLFPLTEGELGETFSLSFFNFPQQGTKHDFNFHLIRKD